jgi:hypothetical protein
MVDTRLFGPEGYFTKKVKQRSTDRLKASTKKQMEKQKTKTFVPGTQTQRPVNQEGARVYKPDYTKIQRVTPEESYKKPEATVNKTKTYRATEAGTDYPVYDSKPSMTTTPSYTKKTETPKPGNMEEGKKKMTGDTSLAAQAIQNAQSLLDRSLRKKK